MRRPLTVANNISGPAPGNGACSLLNIVQAKPFERSDRSSPTRACSIGVSGKPFQNVSVKARVHLPLSEQRGAQAVEFALMLPFMILIIFAVLDFGFLAYDKMIITNASREAVRKSVVLTGSAWSTAAISQTACNYMKNTLISTATGTRKSDCSGGAAVDPVITVTPSTTPAFGEPVTVSISYSVKGFTLGTWYLLGTGPNTVGSAITLNSTTAMNHE